MAKTELFWVIAENKRDHPLEWNQPVGPISMRGFYQKEAAEEFAEDWNKLSYWNHYVRTASQCLSEGIELP
jgi:hypothetical protein